MVSWECPTNPREASGLDPEAVHIIVGMVLVFILAIIVGMSFEVLA